MLRSLALFALVTFASSARAGLVQVNFSGGNGTPLTISLPKPVTYTVTSSMPSGGTLFGFLGVGNLFGGAPSSTSVAGPMTYTTNGGGTLPITGLATYSLGATLTPNDLILFGSGAAPLNLNDVLVLSNDSVTTAGNIFVPPPPSGLYQAILADGNGNQIGTGATPEPASFALLALAGPMLRRRRRA